MFVHHVYFWLSNESNETDKAKLIEGLRKLSKANTIKKFYIGVPADTNRDVIERSYSVSWLLFFDTPADQDNYQVDPIHLKFVEECSMLWKKVVVYDSVDVKKIFCRARHAVLPFIVFRKSRANFSGSS
jgi:hypothetical protein